MEKSSFKNIFFQPLEGRVAKDQVPEASRGIYFSPCPSKTKAMREIVSRSSFTGSFSLSESVLHGVHASNYISPDWDAEQCILSLATHIFNDVES